MPVLDSWRDFLPPSERDAVVAADDALAAARKNAQALDRLEPAHALLGLREAAAEGMKAEVMFAPHIAQRIAGEYDGVVRAAEAAGTLAALHEQVSVDGVAAVVAFFAVTGRAIDPTLLDAPFAGDHVSLGYAAIAAGRADRARVVTKDARVHALATALDTSSASTEPYAAREKVFLELVEAFPTADNVGYADLACASRGFVTHVAGRRVERAARWVRRLVHGGLAAGLDDAPSAPPSATQGPRPLPPPPDPQPTPEQIAREREVLAPAACGRTSDWANVILSDIHGLFGGRYVAVSSAGEVWAFEVPHVDVAFRLHGWLSASALARLEAMIAARDPSTLSSSTRNGIAGEASATLTFVRAGRTTTARRWAGDHDPAFHELRAFLDEVGRLLMATTKALEVGRWRGRFARD